MSLFSNERTFKIDELPNGSIFAYMGNRYIKWGSTLLLYDTCTEKLEALTSATALGNPAVHPYEAGITLRSKPAMADKFHLTLSNNQGSFT